MGINKLHNRIMVPFIALFLLFNLVPLLLNRHYIGSLIDQRIAIQTDRLSRLVSNSEFVLNPIYLSQLRKVIDSDIIVFSQNGTVAATTINGSQLSDLESLVSPHQIAALLETGQDILYKKVIHINQQLFMLTARLIGEDAAVPKKRVMLWVLSPMSDAQSAKAALSFQMGLVSFGGIVIMIIFGHMIARTVTKPMSSLVAVTQQVAGGHFNQKAALPALVELQQLASSINMMSDKLSVFETQVALSSRLAAAGKVTAAMSHEIRNPLSSIKMLVQLLRDKRYIPPEDQQIIQSVLEEIVRMERIVGDVSGISRPAELLRVPCDIQETIKEVLTVMGPKLNHRKVQVVFDSKNELPLISIDRDKVKQVIWNLLLNAMESMPQGGRVNIDIRLRDKLYVYIEDEGCGVDAKHVDEIFRPFYTTKPEGLGLGLSTSKEIMKRHGGDLNIHNKELRGARAIMAFPLPVED